MQLAALTDPACTLGEGPVWEPRHGRLYWTDITGQRLWAWSAGAGAWQRPLAAPAGALVRGPGDTLVAPMYRGFAVVDPATGAARALSDPLAAPPGTLMNDGACDPAGRLVAGAKDAAERTPAAPLLRLGRGDPEVLADGFTVFNGPAFSRDGGRIYYADSPARRILTARYDAPSGAMAAPETFAALGPDTPGYPDGMAVDGEGGLWNARFDGWAVARYAPDGTCTTVLPVPVPRPTAVAFGGPDLGTLFITTARAGLSDAALAQAPLSGAVLYGRPGVTGRVEPILDRRIDPSWT